ncbi:MAG TPA: hypothetical protein VEI98_14890, partial [Xanthobacteraceae bacterium]|nr:hypothetical protein [Xanthobacteraceae bacterium]
MLYLAYQMQSDIMVPVRTLAGTWAGTLAGMAANSANSAASPPLSGHPAIPNLSAAYELIARA